MIAEEEAEATTATELVVELETAVIPRVASERAHLYLAAMLRGEGPDPASQQPEDSEHPHRRTPWVRTPCIMRTPCIIGNRPPPKIGGSPEWRVEAGPKSRPTTAPTPNRLSKVPPWP